MPRIIPTVTKGYRLVAAAQRTQPAQPPAIPSQTSAPGSGQIGRPWRRPPQARRPNGRETFS
jgi:hypothetical protein